MEEEKIKRPGEEEKSYPRKWGQGKTVIKVNDVTIMNGVIIEL